MEDETLSAIKLYCKKHGLKKTRRLIDAEITEDTVSLGTVKIIVE